MSAGRFVLVTAALLMAGVMAVVEPAAAQTSTPAAPGPLQISTVQSGPVIAPEVRFTQINDKTTTLAGGYVGWQTERRLLIGAAGFMNTNRSDSFETQYGGAFARWTFLADSPVSVSTGLLAGFGTATLARPYGELFGEPRTIATNGRTTRFGQNAITSATPVRVRDDFLLLEPQVHLVWTVLPWLRVDAGATYRSSDLLDRQLRGAAGSLAIRFGK